MPKESQKKLIWVWLVVAVFLVVAITAIAIGCVSYVRQQSKERQAPVQPAQVQPEQAALPIKPHADRRYVYAGNPRPMPSFQGQIQVLTNIGYVVGYSEERKDPVWVGYRLFKISSLQAPKRPRQFMVDARTAARVTSTDSNKKRTEWQ